MSHPRQRGFKRDNGNRKVGPNGPVLSLGFAECREGTRLFELSKAERHVAVTPWESHLTQAQQHNLLRDCLGLEAWMTCPPPLALATPYIPPHTCPWPVTTGTCLRLSASLAAGHAQLMHGAGWKGRGECSPGATFNQGEAGGGRSISQLPRPSGNTR